jgi:hypothetical protein
VIRVTKRICRLTPVPVTIEPEPPEQEREAIIAALGEGRGEELGGWSQAALSEGVGVEESDDP